MERISTKIVHEERIEPTIESPAMPPIYQTSTFAFPKAEKLGETISGGPDNEVFIYTRGSNPTQRTLEKSIAKIEGAEDGLSTASGMAAITLAAITYLKSGEHAIVSKVTYGDTHHLFEGILSKYGVETSFVDMTNLDEVRKAVRKNTKVILFETPSNPLLRITDIKAVSKIAKPLGIKVIVDNTIMSPYFQHPLDLGADLSIHSLTKYINGHSDVIGGIILSDKAEHLKLRMNLFTTGAILDPHACWLVLRGVKTLHLRMEAHQKNAIKVLEFLAKHQKVEKIYHPYFKEHPDYALARTQMSGLPSVFTFEVKGGILEARAFINRLKIFKRAVSLGGVESLAEHPASMTHAIIPKAQREAAGIKDNMIRLSIGVEDAEDLIEDLKQALQ
jgi:cystathionine beta-lyase/cystathionine gamma-synthase